MKRQFAALCGIALLSLLFRAPNVLAQTTTITNVSYTRTALFDIDTQTPSPPLIVNATVGYSGAKSGDYLAVGIFDLDDGNLVDGLGSSNPQSCTSAAGSAGCIVPLTNAEGSERMQFSLDHPKGVWNLALIAALLDSTTDPISNSFSDYTFTITVRTALTLTVNVPDNVQVDIDGVNGTWGSLQLVLAAGDHTVSVPAIIPIDNSTRLRFVKWSDGSTATNRTISLNHDVTLDGNYIVQYRLDLISPVYVGGAGWYDTGINVTLSIGPATRPMSGLMGTMGGKWVFEGWALGATEFSKSPTTSVAMNSSLVISVHWMPDYTIPAGVAVLLSLLAGGTIYAMRTRHSSARRAKKRSRRKRRSRPRRHARTRKTRRK